MHYDLSYLKEPIYSDINKQAGNHVLQGTLSATTYENGCILPCLRRDQIEYDYSGALQTRNICSSNRPPYTKCRAKLAVHTPPLAKRVTNL